MSLIPIQNLYYLLIYAWNRFDEASVVDVDTESSPRLVELLGRVLVEGTGQLLRRGLGREYRSSEESTSKPRGRIELVESLRSRSRGDPLIRCAVDDLVLDVPQNRVLHSALLSLSHTDTLEPSTLDSIHGLLLRFRHAGVGTCAFVPGCTRRIAVHRNNARYGLLLDVCEFLAEGLLPSTTAGRFEFPEVPDESLMAAIFEEFVRNFYRRECSWLSGGVEVINWQEAAGEPAALAKLPRMKTDALFRFGGSGWIIDAKYYAETLVAGFPGAEPKARSSHLYQLYAYLMNARRREPTLSWQGMLLYPTVSYAVDLRLELQGLRLYVQTVDLNQPWQKIHEHLLKLASTVRMHVVASRPEAELLLV